MKEVLDRYPAVVHKAREVRRFHRNLLFSTEGGYRPRILSAGVFSYNVRCVNGIRAATVETSTFVTMSTGSCAMKPMQVQIFYDGGHIPSERFESIITNLSNDDQGHLE